MLLGATAYKHPEIHYAWRGSSMLVLDAEGRIGTRSLTGFYFRETRYLNVLGLELNGDKPFPCSIALVEPNRLEATHIYPPVEARGGGGSGSGASGQRHGILFRNIDLRTTYRVQPASVEFTFELTSRWNEQIEFELALLLGADYAGIDEVQAGKREQEAPVESEAEPNGVRFRYTHPDLPLQTQVDARLDIDGAVRSGTVEAGGEESSRWSFGGGRLAVQIALGRQERATVRLEVRAVDFENPIDRAGEEAREAVLEEWTRSVTRLHAPAETPLVSLTGGALRDVGSLSLLDGPEEEWLTPVAGLPLYPAVFGRDAMTTVWQTAPFDAGRLTNSALARLARLQGTRVDRERDEEPGRIIQQARSDPLSRLGRTPFARYYADYASPFMFLIGLGHAFAWQGDKALLERHWDAARRILDWARNFGDRDGDGYLEYRTEAAIGPKHQGWKDTDNAVVGQDGEQVEPPIAPCEIQGYYHAALRFMAVFSFLMGERQSGLDLWKEAEELKKRFNRDFWMDEEGFVAFGLDAEKRPIRALTSNGAQCLPTGVVARRHIPRLVRRMFEPDLFSGWGIRTLSSRNPAYNPLSYHLGSIWPVENASILFGLRRYGYDERAIELMRALYDLALLWPGGRTPECVGGYGSAELMHPGAYPRANAPQAWNQSVFPIGVQTLLGLQPLASLHLLVVDPVLPHWLPEITVRDVRVGDARVTLRFWRDEDRKSHFEVVEKEGTLRILRQPPLESLTVGIWDRLGALVPEVFPGGGGARNRAAPEERSRSLGDGRHRVADVPGFEGDGGDEVDEDGRRTPGSAAGKEGAQPGWASIEE